MKSIKKQKRKSPTILDYFGTPNKAGPKTTGEEDVHTPPPSVLKTTRPSPTSVAAVEITHFADADYDTDSSPEYVEGDTMDKIILHSSIPYHCYTDEQKRDHRLTEIVIESYLRYGDKYKISELVEKLSMMDNKNDVDDSLTLRKLAYLHSGTHSWEDEEADEKLLIENMAHDKYQMTSWLPCDHCGTFCMLKYFLKDYQDDLYSGSVMKCGGYDDISLKEEEELFNRNMRNDSYRKWQSYIEDLTNGCLSGLLPSCVVTEIRNRFPSPAGVYKGWPWNEDELIKLGIDPVEYIKNEQNLLKEIKEIQDKREETDANADKDGKNLKDTKEPKTESEDNDRNEINNFKEDKNTNQIKTTKDSI